MINSIKYYEKMRDYSSQPSTASIPICQLVSLPTVIVSELFLYWSFPLLLSSPLPPSEDLVFLLARKASHHF